VLLKIDVSSNIFEEICNFSNPTRGVSPDIFVGNRYFNKSHKGRSPDILIYAGQFNIFNRRAFWKESLQNENSIILAKHIFAE
jgi:hypothetical protein